MKKMTFKTLVGLIAEIETEEELDKAFACVEFAYQKEWISWNDHETLFQLIENTKAYDRYYCHIY